MFHIVSVSSFPFRVGDNFRFATHTRAPRAWPACAAPVHVRTCMRISHAQVQKLRSYAVRVENRPFHLENRLFHFCFVLFTAVAVHHFATAAHYIHCFGNRSHRSSLPCASLPLVIVLILLVSETSPNSKVCLKLLIILIA